MRAIDTNVLVRLIVRDEPRQVRDAESFVEKGAWVSHVVLAETVWVLDSVYEVTAKKIALAVDMLLNHAQLTLQDADVVAGALDQYRSHPKIGFSDCLILEIARKNGYAPLGTFDRVLGELDGAERL
jgi:predicted nucleic-acid-binding protein